MSSDLRTTINDAEANTGWTGDDTATPVSDTGQFYEGSNSLSTQLSDADEHMYTTQDSVGMGTFNLDWSDVTIYLLVKDNLIQSFANGGVMIVIGDGTDRIGYDVGGYDARGLPLPFFFNCYKLDVSVIVATPGSFATFAGSEANLSQAAATQVGYGTQHLAKAVGSVDNVFMDAIRYIANGSYALRINGGTSGTPEEMADVVGDDISNGWGIVSNPLGSLYYFFAPTEWGEPAANADAYFRAIGEQWLWLGDNGGGHVIGAGNFPFRVIGNATDTISFVISGVAIVNTGAGADFDCSDGNVDTLEIDGCSMTGLATFQAPSAGGTSRFCRNTIFRTCGQITHNGADMSGSSVLESTVAANGAALFYDEATDPDGEMDDMTFSQGGNAHHAITFGTNIPASITLRGLDFSGFSSSDDNDGSIFRFNDTSGSITLNLVGCSHDGSGFTVDDRAGATVTVVVDPVTTLVHVTDNLGADLQNARVPLEAADGTGDFPFEESVSITRSGSTATVSHTGHGLQTNDWAVIRGADQPEYNGPHQITVTGTNSYTFTVSGTPDSPATGTIISSGAIISGLTDVNGDISASRTFTSDTPVKGTVRKSTTSPRFKSFALVGTIDNVTGLTINVRMILDE